MFEVTDTDHLRLNGAKIKVVGVGGGGCNAVNTMIRSGLSGVEYVVANTDAQALGVSLAPTKIQLGGNITKGLGAGANPEVGKKSALEDFEKISEILKGADMVFITAGMGGGTGTGAAPVIAKLAKDLGALTVGVVTKPFVFEGKKRFKQAEEGIRNLEESVDSLITIPNQRLLYLAGENLSLVDTFKKADEVLLNAVRGISDLINNTGHINADFADVSTVMANKGLALMGTGSATGSGRAIKAATEAISSPLLEDVSINGATGIIINITGSDTLSMHETNEAVTLIMEAADENAEIIFGTVIDNNCGDEVKVTVIATGLGIHANAHTHAHTGTKVAHNNANETMTFSQAVQEPVVPVSVTTQTVASQVTQPITQPVVNQFTQNTQRESETVVSNTSMNNPNSNEDRDLFSRRRNPSVSSSFDEERSDFDRFMNDRANYNSNENHREVQRETHREAAYSMGHGHEEQHGNHAGANVENRQPSRLIQSIRDAATKYDNSGSGMKIQSPVNIPNSPAGFGSRTEASEGGLNSRAKSIAEKLGFVNFDEDEFDTPSYLRKDEKTETKTVPNRDFKNLDI